MLTEIITIGDELLIGQVVDTNSAWLGEHLNQIGIEVVRITSVRDRKIEIKNAIGEAFNRADLVLMTGGLGPTKDDITKDVLCDYFNAHLVFNESVYENVKRVLAGRVPINQLNHDQAMVPSSCQVINNRVGTAPVCWFQHNDKILISMPGVPQEMKTVMQEEILPRLKSKCSNEAILHKTLLVRNNPESVLAERISQWEDKLPACIKLAYLPSAGLIRLRLTGRGDSEIIEEAMETEVARLKTILGNDILSESGQSIELVIGEVLRAKALTLATAESCTGGAISAKITSVAGSSAYFKGGVVSYSNEAKINLLNVSNNTLETYGAVSEETVVEMVQGARTALKADCAIAVSGIAGPGGGTTDKPVGTVWIAVAYKDVTQTLKQTSDRGRELNVERAVNNALLLLLELLQ